MILEFIETYMNTPEYALTVGQKTGMCFILLFIFVGLPLLLWFSWWGIVTICEKIRKRRKKK